MGASFPFTRSEFMDVFARYHNAVGFAPLIASALGVVAVTLAFAQSRGRHRLVAVILAALWLWSGSVYHLHFFAMINPAARIFGAMFVLQGALLLWDGAIRQRLLIEPTVRPSRSRLLGALFISYSLLGYPLLGLLMGHTYPRAPTFGLPCPTVIFTLGILIWARRPWPLYLVVIPVLWALVGTVAAMRLDMWEDLGLLAAAVVVLAEILYSRRSDVAGARVSIFTERRRSINDGVRVSATE